MITIYRNIDNGKETLGNLIVTDNQAEAFSCPTLELPDKGNQHNVSCIPKGKYNAIKVGKSANIPYPHIAIQDVKDREGICIHIANFVRELRGCIAVGGKITDLDGDGIPDLTESRKTFEKLMSIVPDSFTVEIK